MTTTQRKKSHASYDFIAIRWDSRAFKTIWNEIRLLRYFRWQIPIIFLLWGFPSGCPWWWYLAIQYHVCGVYVIFTISMNLASVLLTVVMRCFALRTQCQHFADAIVSKAIIEYSVSSQSNQDLDIDIGKFGHGDYGRLRLVWQWDLSPIIRLIGTLTEVPREYGGGAGVRTK